jgi:hypothetical protein
VTRHLVFRWYVVFHCKFMSTRYHNQAEARTKVVLYLAVDRVVRIKQSILCSSTPLFGISTTPQQFARLNIIVGPVLPLRARAALRSQEQAPSTKMLVRIPSNTWYVKILVNSVKPAVGVQESKVTSRSQRHHSSGQQP